MSAVREVRLVQVNPGVNANKFYVCSLDASGTLTKRWGRVGASGQTKIEPGAGVRGFENAVYAKERRGYRRVDTADTPVTGVASVNTALVAQAAKQALTANTTDPALTTLVDRIATANRHAITTASGGRITFTATGAATTALGPVRPAAVAQARLLLDRIAALPTTDPARSALVAEYLTVIPQKVGARRGWDATFAATASALATQHDLLDALEAVTATTVTDATPTITFRYTVALADPDTTAKIAAKFETEKHPSHPSARLHVQRVYALTDDAAHSAAFDEVAAQVRNRHLWWHGSRTHNLLNILRTGLVVSSAARSSGLDFHGAMFGPGAYFGRSTKAANYSIGGVWDTQRDSGPVYVFVADIACGSEFRSTDPAWAKHGWRGSRSTRNPRGKAWDSVYVKGGTAGVINDERVIWNGDQIRLAYLVELGQ